ncbi:AraC-type DNA-binding protein [Reichenbachiella agariperforans]|uniref:AraC-type DNA-binding protein n=1 Tax=Reichenbachiella agariperforans TaxID=156994 RepID=A0A1M6KYQ2_REIAG|nr:AraC-type DNA-binding protein [Reichenbachiella agariperforans]
MVVRDNCTLKTISLPEQLIINKGSSVVAFDYQVEQESTKQQVNLSMNTFSFLTEGNKEVYSDTKFSAISNSEFLLMKSGKCLMTEKFTDTLKRYRSILFFFTDEALLRFIRKYSIVLSKMTERKSVQSIKYDDYLRSFAKSLAHLVNLSSVHRDKVLQVKFEELMLYLIDKEGVELLSSFVISTNEHEHHFQEIVENNKLNRLTINELAFLCNMSISTFKRTFERQFHTSPSKWFQERRLEYAALLLKSEGKRPTDIYLQVGYDSLTNFIQAFKSKYGMTPKQYQLD